MILYFIGHKISIISPMSRDTESVFMLSERVGEREMSVANLVQSRALFGLELHQSFPQKLEEI